MGKELQDGLTLDHSFFMIDEKKTGIPISVRAIQFLAIIIGGWCFVSILREGLIIPFHSLQIYAAVIICTGVMFILCLIPSYDLVKLFFCILFYGLFFYSRLPRLKNGFYIIENLVLNQMSNYYNYQSYQYVADHTKEAADTTLLIIMLLIPVIALLSIAIVRNRLVSICSILLFLPTTVCFLFGIIPSERYLIASVALELYLTRLGSSFRDMIGKEQKTLIHRINSRVAVWLSLIGILLFFILKLFVTENNYNNITEIKYMKNKVQTAFWNFSIEDYTKKLEDIRLFDTSTSVGGLRGGKLGNTGEVVYSNSEQLLVTAPKESISEGIYLKGYVGSVYTGNSWEEHSSKDRNKYKELLKTLQIEEFPPVNQTNLLLNLVLNSKIPTDLPAVSYQANSAAYEIYQGSLEIEYKDANKKYIYAPYFTNYALLDQAYYEQDLYAAPKTKNKSYDFNYFFNLKLGYQSYSIFNNSLGQLGSYPEYEKLYRDYVHQVYTKLPEKGLDRIKEDFSEKKMKSIASSVSGKINYVKEYLDKKTSYTLSPGKLPKGKDFVEYFLYENRRGYCSHYASAATLMLRAMGVPARYVEGYAIGPDQGLPYESGETKMLTAYTGNSVVQQITVMTKVSVLDRNAHAWVEVYIDGCGWIPVEFTPGSAIDNNTSVIDELSMAKDYMNQTDDNEIVPTQIPTTPTPVIEKQDTQKPVDKQDKQDSQAGATDKKTRAKLDIVFMIIFIVLVIAAAGLPVMLRLQKKRRLRYAVNRNKHAITLFAEIEKILAASKGLMHHAAGLEDCMDYVKDNNPYIDAAVFDSCMETVKRARFGKGRISKSELKEIEVFRQQLYTRVYQELPLGKKLYLKFILLM